VFFIKAGEYRLSNFPIKMHTFYDNVSVSGNGNELIVESGIQVINVEFSGNAVFSSLLEGSLDGDEWHSIMGINLTSLATSINVISNGLYQIDLTGFHRFRISVNSLTSGNLTVIGLAVN